MISVCPEGYFGDHCMQPCNCSSEGNWVCDPVHGCMCHRGYIGDKCDIQASEAIKIENSGKFAVMLPYTNLPQVAQLYLMCLMSKNPVEIMNNLLLIL